ncbi:small integral membrane protein 34 [Pleurodeles waltl]|uniref:small integral membrane protein 34 n=1 Tax=Pleurodeles waltl TaxID=8319 RepID=UPI0037094A6B
MGEVNVTFVTTLGARNVSYSTILTSNSTAPAGSDETSAAWYIFTVIGFFGIVMFSLMVSNLLVNKAAEEADPYFQYIEKQTKKKETIKKLATNKFLGFANKSKEDHSKINKDEDKMCSGEVEKQHEEGPKKQQEEGSKEQQGAQPQVQQGGPNEEQHKELPQEQVVDQDSLFMVATKC